MLGMEEGVMNMKSVIRRGGMGILLAVVLAVPLASWGKGPMWRFSKFRE